MNKPTAEQMRVVAEYIQGTCKSVDQAFEACGFGDLNTDDAEDDLLTYDVEMCGVCNWWCEVCELEWDEQAGHGVCDDCR